MTAPPGVRIEFTKFCISFEGSGVMRLTTPGHHERHRQAEHRRGDVADAPPQVGAEDRLEVLRRVAGHDQVEQADRKAAHHAGDGADLGRALPPDAEHQRREQAGRGQRERPCHHLDDARGPRAGNRRRDDRDADQQATCDEQPASDNLWGMDGNDVLIGGDMGSTGSSAAREPTRSTGKSDRPRFASNVTVARLRSFRGLDRVP